MDARAGSSSNQHGSEDHLQMLPGRFRLISTINKTTVYKYSFYEGDHASTVRHQSGIPRVHFAQFQWVPVPSHPRLR
ncbi:hypothetical protein ACWB31_004563, partial [Klebsiella pneumoniae]